MPGPAVAAEETRAWSLLLSNQFSDRGVRTAVQTPKTRFTVGIMRHRHLEFTRIAGAHNLKRQGGALEASMHEDVRIAPRNPRLPFLLYDNVEDDGSAQFAGVIGEGKPDARLTIQFAVPGSHPGFVAVLPGRECAGG